MNFKIKTTMVLACLVLPSIGFAKSVDPQAYRRLNAKLAKIHAVYLRKDFEEIEKIRKPFLKELETFRAKLESGETRLINKIQESDYKLALNYYETLTTYYNAIRVKYGFRPIQQEGDGSEPASPENFVLAKTPDADRPRDRKNGHSTGPDAISVNVGWRNILDQIEDAEDERILGLVIPDPVKTEEEETKLAAAEAAKSPDMVKIKEQQRLKELEEIAQAKKAAELKLKAMKTRQKKIAETYEEEIKQINAGLERMKILKENQARFEMKMNVQESSAAPAPIEAIPSRQRVIFSRDRLSDNDDDVIIIKFPRTNR